MLKCRPKKRLLQVLNEMILIEKTGNLLTYKIVLLSNIITIFEMTAATLVS